MSHTDTDGDAAQVLVVPLPPKRAARRDVSRAQLAQMVSAATSGDPHAWGEIVDRYGDRVRAVARRYRLSPHDVDDVAQNTWLRLLKSIHAIRQPEALGAWLETTARHEALRLLKSGGIREFPADHAQLPDAIAPAEPDVGAEHARLAALGAAFARLPARHAALMHMLIAEEAPNYAEISRTLAMPIGSIGPIRARALDRLRQDPGLLAELAA
jgi:RNA polymerase sigma factor (sigma-70 family)